jgi:hypothetical protein
MDYKQVITNEGSFKIDNGSERYNIEYENIYNYNNYLVIIIIIFVILFTIYLFGVLKNIN